MNLKKASACAALYCLFAVIYLLSALYFQHYNSPTFIVPTIPFNVLLHLSATEISTLFNGGDASSYINSGMSLLATGHFTPWTLGLWPPGQMLIAAAVIKLTGPDDYILKMLVLSGAAWSLVFTLAYHSFDNVKNPLIKILLAIAPLYFFTVYTFVFGYALILSENLSLPLFLIATCLLISWLKHKRIRSLLAAATVLAVLTYLRGYFELFGNFLCLAMVIYLAFKMIQARHYNIKLFLTENISAIIMALILYNAILFPWRLHNFVLYGSFAWLNQSYIWGSFWTPSIYFPGIDVACLAVSAQFCHLVANNPALGYADFKDMTLMVLISHPLNWYRIKLQYFNYFWFGNSWHNLLHNSILQFIEGIVIIIAGTMATAIGLWTSFKKPSNDQGLYLFSLLFILFNLGLFTFYHFEERYSMFLQILFIYLPLWLLFGFKTKK
ncbi:MAG: hypothetical protein Q7V63_08215 [Gammaproteobacteria bacterium]|nr:hypothetical protein [Gammaproteobacteria bacterium]